MSVTLSVTGLTCGHCAASVTEELTAVTGVEDVQVDVVKDGESTVTVTGTIDEAAAQAAIEEAGYTLVSYQA